MRSYRSIRQLASVVCVLGGIALLVYGLFFHMTVVSSAEDVEANALTRRESVLIRDVTIGQGRPTVEAAAESEGEVEVAKDADAPGGEAETPKAAPKKKAPKACPT